jgi:hypothetical protein
MIYRDRSSKKERLLLLEWLSLLVELKELRLNLVEDANIGDFVMAVKASKKLLGRCSFVAVF